MRGLAPWTGMTGLRREMDRLFDRFFEGDAGWEALEIGGEWAPKVDLSETKDAYVVRAEVPGVEQKDIQVSLQNDLLTIKGEKTKEKEEKDEEEEDEEEGGGGVVGFFGVGSPPPTPPMGSFPAPPASPAGAYRAGFSCKPGKLSSK